MTLLNANAFARVLPVSPNCIHFASRVMFISTQRLNIIYHNGGVRTNDVDRGAATTPVLALVRLAISCAVAVARARRDRRLLPLAG